MCRPRFCEIQKSDAVEVQQFHRAQAKQVYHHHHDSVEFAQRRAASRVPSKPSGKSPRVRQQTHRTSDVSARHGRRDIRAVAAEEIQISPLQRTIACGVGTVGMTLFMTPLDVVKTRLQAQQQIQSVGRSPPSVDFSRCFLRAHPEPRLVPLYRTYHSAVEQLPTRFNGTLDGLVKIARNEGLPRLWSGLPPTLLMRIPSNVIYFTVYEEMKSFLGFNRYRKDANNAMATSAASGTARGMSITCVSPLELIRTKMQAKAMTYRELGKVLEDAIKHEGIKSLWKGLGPQILRDVPYAILYWSNYEMLKTQMSRSLNTGEPTVAITFGAGALAGVLASVVTTPFDVVKTHKQISVGDHVGLKAVNSTTWAVMKQLHSEAGVRALFVGLVPRVIKAAPASAILVTSYEFTITLLEQYNARQAGYTT